MKMIDKQNSIIVRHFGFQCLDYALSMRWRELFLSKPDNIEAMKTFLIRCLAEVSPDFFPHSILHISANRVSAQATRSL